ncbi:MAG: S-layer homology domain-containing protein [Oscillospiraceae bacterium]|nr:S-layer homology domain-containing protein [Oscillospiraceae bacterium]
MKKTIKRRPLAAAARNAVCVCLALAMAFGLLGGLLPTASAAGSLTVEKPSIVVTGTAVIGGQTFTAENVSCERSYTLDELKAAGGVTHAYSAINTFETRKLYLATGVPLTTLLAETAFNAATDKLTAKASDGFVVSFDPNATYTLGSTSTTGFGETRWYYPNLLSGSDAGAVKVETILAWASENGKDKLPTTTKDCDLTIVAGQLSLYDQNNPLYNRGVNTLLGGDVIRETVLTAFGKSYSRAEILLMDRAQNTYTYMTKKGEMTDTVRGVPLASLLAGVDSAAKINFSTADNYAVSSSGMTVADLIAGNYIVAYEILKDGKWTGLYREGGGSYGVLYLYGENGQSPAAMLTGIETAASKYKHMDSGVPYNIDSLTGATLTVEGPGVSATTPIRVSDVETTSNTNLFTGSYANGEGKTFSYEGVDVLAIIDGIVNTSVEKENGNVVVVFKNRLRQDIAKIAYSDIKAASAAGKPVILAYGVSDGQKTAPYVFDNAAGYIAALGNNDGPVRLVYDPSYLTAAGTSADLPAIFKSCAYLYVEQGAGAPGFKHSEASDAAYDNPANTDYFITFTGSALGREVNLTVAELEAMVKYGSDGKPAADGIGLRQSYGLSNTTYWYVNEYEGVELWKLLTQKLGISASTYENDKNTFVSFASWDNYKTTAVFSMYQLAHPDVFYFYEKSPLDIGTDRPTKAQLATEEYQPTRATTDTRPWTTDANGYPILKGYPVMLAYGVNGYPYVLNNKLDGYYGGLGNDGGPLKVIFGKTDGMNRTDATAVDNYAYFYNNGSNQLQRAQEVYVGDDARYSTHLENPAYASMASADDYKLTVELVTESGTTTKTYTLGELESILYGPGVTKTNIDTQGRRDKGYYAYKYYNDAPVEDLFEGVDLWYLISEDIGLSSYIGTVSMYKAGSDDPSAVYTLDEIQQKGGNSLRGTDGLGMMVAFAKNGYPLVADSSAAGYVKSDSVTGITVKNSGGPLMFLRAQSDSELASGTIATGGDKACAVENLAKIVINIEPDKYAHDASNGADEEINFTGAVASAGKVKIGTIETKQKYLVTEEYTVGGVKNEYRGIALGSLLNDPLIGASALMESVTVKNAAGQSVTLMTEDLMDPEKNVILAYGMTSGGEGAPLTTANGGYMRLVMNGGSAAECITNVSEIEVTAAEIDGWFHNFGNYTQFKDYTIEVSGDGIKTPGTYTVEQIEAMSNIIVRDSYQMGGTYYIEGIDLYKFLSGIGFAGGGTSAAITVYATDNYAIGFDATQLSKGINGKPMLLAYGQGTTATNGLPLVINDTDPGYDPNIGNAFGPLRLVVNDNTGWCNKYVSKIVVGNVSGGGDEPAPAAAREFKTYEIGTDLPFAGIRYVVSDGEGGFWAGSRGAGLAHVKASGETDVFTTTSSPALKTDYATAVAVDKDGGVWFSQNANYTSPEAQNFGIGYMKDGEITWYDKAGGQIPDDYVQVIEIDEDGSVWFGSFSGLTKYDGENWTTWTEADGLPAESVSALAFDDEGLWVGTYPDGGGRSADDLFTGGFVHMDRNGNIDFTQELTGEFDSALGSSLLAQAWVRSVEVDNAGDAWIVCSGSYANLPNVGGTIYRVSGSNGSYKVDKYTGADLLGSNLKGNTEVRVVMPDPVNGYWIATSGSGLFYAPTLNDSFTEYSCAKGTWNEDSTLLDNIYTLSFDGHDIFAGSEGGVAVMKGAADFIDLPEGFWASEYIYELAKKGIIYGTGGKTYTPAGNVTRAQFVTLLARATESFDPAEWTDTAFTDVVKGSWYEAAVNWAAANGIVNGVGNGKYAPNADITRQDMATMLYRYINAMGLELTDVKSDPDFADETSIASYAKDAVHALYRLNIVNGMTETEFGPTKTAVRAQAAAIISRLLAAE